MYLMPPCSGHAVRSVSCADSPEIRARRPVLITANRETLLALPVDGVDSSRLTAFKNFCSPHRPKLILSAPRARWLGFQTSVPMALTVATETSVEQLLELVVNLGGRPYT